MPNAKVVMDLERQRAIRFSEDEIKVLVHEVKQRQRTIYGSSAKAPNRENAKQAWVEVAAAVSSFSGIERTVDQVKKRFDSTKRTGKKKVCHWKIMEID